MKRKLVLKTEPVADLSAEELTGVAAGHEVTGGGLLCVTQWATVCEVNHCYTFPGC